MSLIALPTHAQIQHAQSVVAQATFPDSPGYIASAAADITSITSAASSQNSANPATLVHPATSSIQAPLYSMRISPNETAQRLSAKQTTILGLRQSVSTFAMAGSFASAGWSHLLDTSPNYGTDSAAFGERLGAAALRGVSKGIFSNAVFAPLLHEDPRFYRMGKANGNIGRRLRYAGTRVLITRTADGRPAPNLSLIAGSLASSALTVTYYPSRNTNLGDVGKTFGNSLIGSLIGCANSEFLPDILAFAHLKKHE
jgi:hypothetical protein